MDQLPPKAHKADRAQSIAATIGADAAKQLDQIESDGNSRNTHSQAVKNESVELVDRDSPSKTIDHHSTSEGAFLVEDGTRETLDPSQTIDFQQQTETSAADDNLKTVDFSYTDAGSAARSVEASARTVVPRFPKMIGQYAIDRVLGRGGMGIVYKARQLKLGRDVALKMVLAGSHASDELLARFIVEAKAVAHLQHPNIVQIFEVGEHEGLPYFSLEFVDGAGLDRQLAGKPLSPEQAARLTITLCKAMQYAHDHGVLHRDLKPANILMTSDGNPKVTDFGLAKRLEDNDDSSSTRTGTIMGTPSYMSPEQARGAVQELGPATDQYSLGAVLYELLTGRPPFLAPKPVETIMQVLSSEPVPPRQLQPRLPIDIETICLKALQKDHTKRYNSCTELAADLGRFLNHEPILARPVGLGEKAWRWCRRNPVIASLATASALALVAVASVTTWSALVLREKNTQLVKSQEEITKQSGIAKENESRALEQETIANSRADSIVKVVKDFFTQVLTIDVEEVPRMEGTRDSMLAMLLPVLEREVLKDKPTDSNALLARYALQKQLAERYVAQNKKEDAEKIYLDLSKELLDRALLKKTDAARNNYLQVIRSLGDLKRELYRDMAASLAYHRQHLEIATDIWNNSRADETGLGKYSEFQRADLVTRAHHDLATTLFRIGQLSDAKEHFAISEKGYNRMLELQDSDTWFLKKSEAERRSIIVRIQRALATSQLANSTVLSHLGEPEIAEPVFRRLYEESKKAYELDVTNAGRLLSYCGKIGVLAEFLAQHGKGDEALGLLSAGTDLSSKLMTFAPNNSEFQRTNALAHYRLCQFGRALAKLDADEAGKIALRLRRDRVKLDPKNDRYRIELMLSEAQIGDIGEANKIADEYLARPDVDNELLVEIACAFAQIIPRTEEPERKEEQISKAIASIRRAIEQDYGNADYLTKVSELKPLQGKPEFEALIDSISIKAADRTAASITLLRWNGATIVTN